MSFCLPKELTSKFIAAIKAGQIEPGKLINMTSAERRSFLEDVVGKEHARDVNALLESKLLLKDQQRGLVSWAKQVAGITEPVRNDLISRIGKMDKVLDFNDEHGFLADLAAKKLGTEITPEEAKTVASLSSRVTESKAAIKPEDPVGSDARIKYGANYVALQNYVHELKRSNAPTFMDKLAGAKTSPRRAVIDTLSTLAGVAKGLKASFDASYIGRQGFRAVFTNPRQWGTAFVKNLEYFGKQLYRGTHSNSVLDAVKADIYSRPNALSGIYQKMGLDIGLDTEEAFPTALPEKIPGLGRFYKASEVAYNGTAMRLRADIADHYLKIAENNGVDLTDDLELKSAGRLVNSLTGRGSLGSLEKNAKTINTLFFSPKSLKASFDVLTVHAFDEMSTYARVQAAKNILRIVAGFATIMAVANALWPHSAEQDSRSADFGKIKGGDTRFDYSGGTLSLVTLASRIVTMSSKSSTTGQVNPLNAKDKNGKPKYGAQTALDVAFQFATNKASPLAGVLIAHLAGEYPDGTAPGLANDTKQLLAPLPATNVQELMNDPNSANVVLAELFDSLGFVTNTYSAKPAKTKK